MRKAHGTSGGSPVSVWRLHFSRRWTADRLAMFTELSISLPNESIRVTRRGRRRISPGAHKSSIFVEEAVEWAPATKRNVDAWAAWRAGRLFLDASRQRTSVNRASLVS